MEEGLPERNVPDVDISELFSVEDVSDQDRPIFVERVAQDINEYQYYEPVRWGNTCTICHSEQTPGVEGAGQGTPVDGAELPFTVIKVKIPYEETQSSIHKARAILIAVAIVTVFVSMIALYVIIRLLVVRPLKHLRDVSDRISHGDLDSRAEISTDDEFEELGTSFNKMVRHLTEAQDELRRKILLSSNAGGLGEKSLDSNAIQMLTSLVGMDNTGGGALGRLVIDLEGILNGTVPDIILEDGDKIHVPRLQQTVTVIGEVFAPNTHLFSKSLSLNDYINQSGGSNVYADEGSIYLIKSDGSIIPSGKFSGGSFFRGRDNFIEPGDTIVVPLLVTPFSGIKATTEITQIIYQMALAAAAVNSFTN